MRGAARGGGSPTPRGSGPVLQAHPRPASPAGSAEEHLEETAQRCWDRDSPNAHRRRVPCQPRRRWLPTRWSRVRAKHPSPSLAEGPSRRSAWGQERWRGEAGGPRAPRGSGAQAGQWAPAGTPLPALARLGRDRQALGGNPSGTLPPAPQRCSFLVPFALSPPACMLCRRAEADPGICGRKLQKHGLCAHEFCLVSSLGAPSSFPTGSPCPALLITSSSFLLCSFLPTSFFGNGTRTTESWDSPLRIFGM